MDVAWDGFHGCPVGGFVTGTRAEIPLPQPVHQGPVPRQFRGCTASALASNDSRLPRQLAGTARPSRRAASDTSSPSRRALITATRYLGAGRLAWLTCTTSYVPTCLRAESYPSTQLSCTRLATTPALSALRQIDHSRLWIRWGAAGDVIDPVSVTARRAR